MSLTFYHVPYSTSNSIASVLDELDHGHPEPLAKRIELSFETGDLKKADFLAVNPNGRVPAILHNGTPIWESAAITMYLGETFGVERSLYPALGPKRGEAMQWIVWANTRLVPSTSALSASLRAEVPEGAAAAVGEEKKAKEEAARKEILAGLAVLNGALEGREFVLGSEYCLADTHLWSFISWITMTGVSLDSCGNVKAWLARVGGRPAHKRA